MMVSFHHVYNQKFMFLSHFRLESYISRSTRPYLFEYHDTRAGIAQWYSTGLRAGRSGVRVPAGAGNFTLLHRLQTGSGAHTASYSVGTTNSFPGVKRPGREATTHLHLVPMSRMCGATPPIPKYAFMACCSIRAQGQIYLLPLPLP
jgi:hypothetical protein